MDLKDFVDTTIRQIVEGVVAAQAHVAQIGGAVNPAFTAGATDAVKTDMLGVTANHVYVYRLAFDVAVTVHESKQGGGEAKVEVAGFFKVGGGGAAKESSSSVSRMQFIVPIVFPEDRSSREAKDASEARQRAKNEQAIASSRTRGSPY